MEKYFVLGVDTETSHTFFCTEGCNDFDEANQGFQGWLHSTPPPKLYSKEDAEVVKLSLQGTYNSRYKYVVVEASEEYLQVLYLIKAKGEYH